MSRCLALSLLGSTTLLAACATPMASRAPQQTVTVGIVALNDFHGNLEPPRQSVLASDGKGGTVAVPAGGAAWLASAVDAVRGQYANHLTVAAGDLISASQLSSALFLDEPTIGVMNRMGLDFSAVGNHEFDRGQDELQRMQAGGCEKFTTRQPCQIEPFSGAHFGYLAASTHRTDGSTVFPATALRHFGKGRSKVTVGLIGLTLKGTPQLVSPDGIRGLTFADEAETINALVPGLKRQGADAIVVLIHQGGRTQGPPDPNQCNALAGEIAPILDQLDPQVDVIVSGHTHAAYVCEHPSRDAARPFLLTSASFYGQMLTDITLEIDPASDRVVSKRARNVIVQSEGYASSRGTVAPTALYPAFSPRADVSTYVQRYVDASAELTRRPVGHLTAPATRGEGATA
ncbi:MAG: metallophosphoesterase, partial [Novosphingobium sp.]